MLKPEQIMDLKRAIKAVEELKTDVEDIIQPSYGACYQVDEAINDASDHLYWLAEYWEACLLGSEQELKGE